MKFATLFVFFVSLTLAALAGPETKFAYHTVEKGETVYSISRQYGIKPNELAAYNEAVGGNMTIRIGQKLKVPSSAVATSEREEVPQPISAAPASSSSASSEYHVVKKGETFYSIARQFNVARAELQRMNDLDDLNLKIGQKLLVKRDHAQEVAMAMNSGTKKEEFLWPVPKVQESNVSTDGGDVTASAASVGLASTRTVKSWKVESAAERMEVYRPKATYDPSSEYESVYYQNVYSGLTKKTETGVVKLMPENNTAHVAYYNKASVGTILKLTNTDNGKTTYAIVVGKVPEAENNTYLVKISERVARNLSLRDYNSVEVVCYTEN